MQHSEIVVSCHNALFNCSIAAEQVSQVRGCTPPCMTMRFFLKNAGSRVQAWPLLVWQQKICDTESTQVRLHFHTGNATLLSLLILLQSPSWQVQAWEQVLLHHILRALSTLRSGLVTTDGSSYGKPSAHCSSLMLARLGTYLSFRHSCSLSAILKYPSQTFTSNFSTAPALFFPLAYCDTGKICWPMKERLLVLSSLAMRTLVHRFSMMSMVAIITMLCISSSVSK